MASYTNLYDLVDDFSHDLKRHIRLKEERIQTLEAEIEKADVRNRLRSRITALERENALLREEAGSSQTDKNASAIESALFKKLERHNPKNFIHEDPTADQVLSSSYSALADGYREMYSHAVNMTEAYCTVRNRLRIAQKKATKWCRNFKQDSFEINVDGEPITFQRVASCNSGGQHEVTGNRSAEQAEIAAAGPGLNPHSDQNIAGRQSRLQDLELAPTQSQDPKYDPVDQPPQLLHSSSGSPVFLSSKQVRKSNISSNASMPTAITRSAVETGSATRPVIIKSESSSENSRDTGRNMQYNTGSDDIQDAGKKTSKFSNITAERDRTPGSRIENHRLSPETRPLGLGTKRRQVLREVDRNSLSSPRYGMTVNGKRRRFACRGAAAVPSVAEDGEAAICGNAHRNGTKETVGTSTSRAAATNRVLDLLDMPPSPRPILLTTPRTAIRAPHSRARIPTTENVNSTEISNAHDNNVVDNDVDPEQEPLRCRPLDRLSLEHFKLNPDRNQGLDYAYEEVIRDRSARKCLPGCLAQTCCGPVFRAMARSEIPRDVQFSTLTQEHHQLLEEYHGDQRANLHKFPDKRLYELLLEAKAWQLSNRFSRHRHAHGRASSPPGFWRIDMPTTQEEEADREKARKIEREKVYERYQEALRGNGVWTFADE
ncbi:hypothetical protein PRK78_007335 [Emydomyces testavorans]|uniref:DNA endonuclease activator Ctp1 C-terminal domain-containing protein n=1 Tax=Emydomyces testavorans TaxID=2070801 RepID=A0AAF0DP54_9EURO|nr:hypothetical protein PRK78_007335 [Emydomyces testavorans]